ncbi:HdeD family acid-resistance protein [Streptomyces sp. NPDC004610]|uniref:HdeD family acid-resistance protein n=1 Tax=unclassified Streptomyces TaxID=2593676 RepID=UPI0033AA6FEE
MTESPGPEPSTGPDPRAAARTATPRPQTPGDGTELLGRLGRSWTWMLGSAVVTLVPGILMLCWPDATLRVLGILVGLYLLAIGVFRFVAVFGREEHGERLPGLLVAVLFLLAGVLCLRHPLQTVAALSLIVGIVWLVSGVLTLYTAATTKDLPHRGVVLGIAVLAIVAGIVVLALPTESARALTRLLGLWLVLLGLAEVGLALAWRTALRRAGVTGRNNADGVT